MSDHMNKSLSELKQAIIEDGIVDAAEVAQLRERLYADGVIDREEADFLFAVNDAVSGNANDSSWCDLFVESICDHLLKDDESPGAVDKSEAAWLIAQIRGDNNVDDNERALLAALGKKATSIPDSLKELIESA